MEKRKIGRRKAAFWLAAALFLATPSALAEKARGICTDAEAAFHAAHLSEHIGREDLRCTADALRVRSAPGGKKILGAIGREERFVLLEMREGWARVETETLGRTGWVSADYLDCPCTDEQYQGLEETAVSPFDSYEEILRMLDAGLREQWSIERYADYGVDEAYDLLLYCAPEDVGVQFSDLDGDGRDELLIFAREPTSDEDVECRLDLLFTQKEGKPSLVFCGWVRNRYYLCRDGSLLNEGSSGVADSCWGIFTLSQGKLVLQEGVHYAFQSETEPCYFLIQGPDDDWLLRRDRPADEATAEARVQEYEASRVLEPALTPLSAWRK